MTSDFKEIAHSGGKVKLSFRKNERGQFGYQVGYSSDRPVPMKLISIYATSNGIPIAPLPMGGIGSPWPAPPIPEAVAVFVASDSEGWFGHNCPTCGQYWRSGPWPTICPYCAAHFPSHECLSKAQLRYVEHYCKIWDENIGSTEEKDVVLDMDAVADAVGKAGEKPSFYVSEESQQLKFKCGACDEFNDIIGRFGYCSSCGTRNDLDQFIQEVDKAIRERLRAGTPPENCLKDAVGFFDSFMSQMAKQLVALVPMSNQRKARLLKQRFFDIDEVRTTFLGWFDIDLYSDPDEDQRKFLKRSFCRRHVYEHNAGEVDQKYIDQSGDTSVRLKQHIHESPDDVHRLLSLLVKVAGNVHKGFHDLLPPLEAPIKAFEEKKENEQIK